MVSNPAGTQQKNCHAANRDKALHDNRNTLEKSSPLGHRQRMPRSTDQGHIVTAVLLHSVAIESRQQLEKISDLLSD